MKKSLLAALSVAFLSSTAFAADLAPGQQAYKADAPVVVPASWTGFYIGADVGYGWNANGLTSDLDLGEDYGHALIDAGLAPHGVVLGGGIGADYQLGHFVTGIVSDISWSDINNSKTFISILGGDISGSLKGSAKLDWFGTTRGRVGYLITPALLAYGTGGVAYGAASATVSLDCGSSCGAEA